MAAREMHVVSRATEPASRSAKAPLGILAGGGTLPLEIATHARDAAGRAVHIVALRGEADQSITQFPHTWVGWGQIGGMVRALRRHGCRELVLAGTVRRPNLRTLRPDLGLLMALPRILRVLRGGDDSVLRRVVGFFEAKGFAVVGLSDVAAHLLAGEGALGRHQPTPEQRVAIERGLALLAALGPFDVGQGVVATSQAIVAIEGAGGTDAMLAELATRAPPEAGRSGVLVKWPKPGQELRLDLPAVGPRTVELATRAGVTGIAVQAGAAVLLERAALRAAADAAGMFVVGGAPRQDEAGQPPIEGTVREQLRMHTRRIPSLDERRDIGIGRQLLRALEPHGAGASAIVSRQYVLAVAAQETLHDLLARAGGLRQWGRRRKRTGLLLVRELNPSPIWCADESARERLITGLQQARLVGLVVSTPGLREDVMRPLAMRFDEARLLIVTSELAP